MSEAILVLNPGSSSIKFSVFPGRARPSRQDLVCEGECEGIGHQARFWAKESAGASLVYLFVAQPTRARAIPSDLSRTTRGPICSALAVSSLDRNRQGNADVPRQSANGAIPAGLRRLRRVAQHPGNGGCR